MAKRVVSVMLMVLAGAVAANCGDDSDGSSSGDGGMGPGGSGTIDDAGESAGGSGATSTGGNMGSSGEAGNSSVAGAGDVGGASLGGAGGAGGADGVSVCPASIADFPSVYAEAICRKRVECCENDAQTCLAEVTAAMDELYPDLAQAGLDGIATADCQALEQCVAAVDAADCADWPKELGSTYGLPVNEPACRGIVKGTLAPAAECSSTYECNNGFCNDGDGAGGAGATCLELVADGQACNGQNICNFATSYCAPNNMCAPRLANGMGCTSAAQCQSRVCDTAGTDTCVAPDTTAQCEFVPEGCSLGRGPVRDSRGWPLLVAALVLGAGVRRRRRQA